MTPSKLTNRGFRHQDPITTDDGQEVRVYESSSAEGAYLWLNVKGNAHLDTAPKPLAGTEFGRADGSVSAHLSLDQARAVREAIDEAIGAHYQTDSD